MAEVETLYSARQLADELEITLQMLSKYAQAYTKLTKQQIRKQGRDGRHFTPEQREVIKNARDMVRENTGVTVEDAMKRALVFDAVLVTVELGSNGAAVDLAALTGAFRTALQAEVTAPLVKELQSLKAEIAELKDSQDSRQARQVEKLAQVEATHSAVVRFVLWVERKLRHS